MTNPNTTNQKNSGGPKAKTMGLMTGRRAIVTIAPPIDPTKQDVADTATARAPSPFWARGYPSKHVAAFGGVPGVFKRMAGTDPPNVTLLMMPAKKEHREHRVHAEGERQGDG